MATIKDERIGCYCRLTHSALRRALRRKKGNANRGARDNGIVVGISRHHHRLWVSWWKNDHYSSRVEVPESDLEF